MDCTKKYLTIRAYSEGLKQDNQQAAKDNMEEQNLCMLHSQMISKDSFHRCSSLLLIEDEVELAILISFLIFKSQSEIEKLKTKQSLLKGCQAHSEDSEEAKTQHILSNLANKALNFEKSAQNFLYNNKNHVKSDNMSNTNLHSLLQEIRNLFSILLVERRKDIDQKYNAKSQNNDSTSQDTYLIFSRTKNFLSHPCSYDGEYQIPDDALKFHEHSKLIKQLLENPQDCEGLLNLLDEVFNTKVIFILDQQDDGSQSNLNIQQIFGQKVYYSTISSGSLESQDQKISRENIASKDDATSQPSKKSENLSQITDQSTPGTLSYSLISSFLDKKNSETLVNSFCSYIEELINKGLIDMQQMKPKGLVLTIALESRLVAHDDIRDQFKAKLVSKNKQVEKFRITYYSAILYLPHSLKYFFHSTEGIVKPKMAYKSMIEAVDNIYQLTLEKLVENKLLDEQLNPNLKDYLKVNAQEDTYINESSFNTISYISIPEQSTNSHKQEEEEEKLDKTSTSKNNFNQSINEIEYIDTTSTNFTNDTKSTQQTSTKSSGNDSYKESSSKNILLTFLIFSRYLASVLINPRGINNQTQPIKREQQKKCSSELSVINEDKSGEEDNEEKARQDDGTISLRNDEHNNAIVREDYIIDNSSNNETDNQDKSTECTTNQQPSSYDREETKSTSVPQQNKRKDIDRTYPYASCQECLGYLIEKYIYPGSASIKIDQDQKQKKQNIDYLEQLFQSQVISEEQKENAIPQDTIYQYQIKVVQVDPAEYNLSKEDLLDKIMFFHFWHYYLIYCGTYRFYKLLLQDKFSFSQPLFHNIINMAKRQAAKSPSNQQYLDELIFQDKHGTIPENNTKSKAHFAAPFKFDKKKQCYTINLKLIDEAILFVQSELLKIISEVGGNTPLHSHIERLNLDKMETGFKQKSSLENIKRQSFHRCKAKHAYYCYANGNSFSLQEEINSWQSVNTELDSSKSIEDMNWKSYKMIINKRNNNAKQLNDQKIEQSIAETQYDVQSYYFVENGIYLSLKENPYIYKCRKFNHFIDLTLKKDNKSKSKRETLMQRSNTSDSTSFSANAVATFDYPEKLLQQMPITYFQYQILQTSCYCYIPLSEILKIYEFIQKFFKGCQIHYPSDALKDKPMQFNIAQQKEEGLSLHQQHQTKRLLKWRNINDLDTLLMNYYQTISESLTAPAAQKPTNYERLEFYGDTVITFLVNLEIFLTKEPDLKESQMDFLRLKAVNNLFLAEVCKSKENEIYKYMIAEVPKMFDNVLPAGFTQREYNQVKIKHLNELKSKKFYLKQQRLNLLQQKEKNSQLPIVTSDYLDVVSLFLNYEELQNLLKEKLPQAFTILMQENKAYDYGDSKNIIRSIAKRWYVELGKTCEDLQILVIDGKLQKVRETIRNERKKRCSKAEQKSSAKAMNQGGTEQSKKSFNSKQFADVVESITGAVTDIGGLYSTQEFLQRIKVLKEPFENYIKGIKKYSENKNVKPKVLTKEEIIEIENILNYRFENKNLLQQALIHKSFKVIYNSQKKHEPIEDYERLEYLGDSILNFLISQYFFEQTKDQPKIYNPERLHKLKSCMVNNMLLSFIVIQKGLQKYIKYGENQEQFKYQINKYVAVITEILEKSKEELKAGEAKGANAILKMQYDVQSQQDQADKFSQIKFDLASKCPTEECKSVIKALSNREAIDILYDYNLKIFADCFESIVAAVFLDSRSIQRTYDFLMQVMKEFLQDNDELQKINEHYRTETLQLWQSKPYLKPIKLSHQTQHFNRMQLIIYSIVSEGFVTYQALVSSIDVRRVKFKKDEKKKIRKFYKDLKVFVEEFIKDIEAMYPHTSEISEKTVFDCIKKFRKSYQIKNQQPEEEKLPQNKAKKETTRK